MISGSTEGGMGTWLKEKQPAGCVWRESIWDLSLSHTDNYPSGFIQQSLAAVSWNDLSGKPGRKVASSLSSLGF